MKLLTGLFRFARKRVQTVDTDMGTFRDKLNELVSQKDTLTDEEIVSRVDEIKAISADLPEGDDKAKLDRFLEDFKAIKEQDEATAKEAAGMVADLFEKLDTEAMKDIPDVEETPAPAEVPSAEEVVAETVAEEKTEDGGEVVEKEEVEVKDDANSEYTLEEIYQFIKKRMAEDCAADSAGKVEEEKEEEEIVTDNAPRIPVTMNGSSGTKDAVDEMFDNIFGGR